MKQIIALAVSILIMAAIFSRIDLAAFKQNVSEMNPWLLTSAVLFFIPQIAVTAFRWKEMVRKRIDISLWESVKLILAGNALNILLPSRVGDLSKAYFLKREGKLDIKRGMNIVFFEKYIDLASLGVVIVAGIFWTTTWDQPSYLGLFFALITIGMFPILYFLRLDRWLENPFFEKHRFLGKIKHFLLDSQEYLQEIKNDTKQLSFILALSVFLWFLHILQFYVIFLSFHSQVSLSQVFRLVPLAILVGLIPLTLAGVGTRDSALIYFFTPYEAAARVVGVGLFASLRYFVPGILGLPFLNQYIIKEPSVP